MNEYLGLKSLIETLDKQKQSHEASAERKRKHALNIISDFRAPNKYDDTQETGANLSNMEHSKLTSLSNESPLVYNNRSHNRRSLK